MGKVWSFIVDTPLSSYLLRLAGAGDESDEYGDDEGDAGQDEGEVQVVYLGEHVGARLGLVTPTCGRRVGEVDAQTAQARRQTRHQAPEGALRATGEGWYKLI